LVVGIGVMRGFPDELEGVMAGTSQGKPGHDTSGAPML
jgi:hypothetical protein